MEARRKTAAVLIDSTPYDILVDCQWCYLGRKFNHETVTSQGSTCAGEEVGSKDVARIANCLFNLMVTCVVSEVWS